MKAETYLMIVSAVLVCFGGVAFGESEPAEERGYIGIRMDTRPLPELLIKHLRLDEGQGVRIQNVGVGTAADKAGLERDDIIVGLNGKPVTDNKKFSEVVQKAGVGAEVSLDIIHLGKRKTVKLKLASFTAYSAFKAKFPPEPEAVQSWQPGRVFQLQPDAQSWIQIGPGGGGMFGGAGGGFGAGGGHMNTFFKEVYAFHYSTDGKEYTITIEGDPNDKNTEITVDTGDSHFMRRLENIDKLPEEYREAVEEALKKARKMAEARQYKKDVDRFVLPKAPDWQMFRDFNQRPDAFRQNLPPNYFNQRQDTLRRHLAPNLKPRGDMFERIEKQMREMQERIEELEKERGKKPEHEDEKSEGKEAHEHETHDSGSHEGEKI